MPSVVLDSEAQWHELRSKNIGASESCVLLGWGYSSPFELYMQKIGRLAQPDLSQDERVVIGQSIEAGIATAAEKLLGVVLTQAKAYVTHPTITGMGCTPDYMMLTADAGHVPVEVKAVAWDRWADEWNPGNEPDDEIEPPPHIAIQLQHQLACCGSPYGFVLVLVAGSRLRLIRQNRHAALIAQIENAVSEFWQRVKEERPYSPDLTIDLSAMQKVYRTHEGTVDFSGNAELETLVATYAKHQQGEAAAAKLKEATKAQIVEWLHVQGAPSRVVTDVGRITQTLKPAEPERHVLYKAQPERLDVRVNPTKETKQLYK
jgi:predicted phage-related endonuclease